MQRGFSEKQFRTFTNRVRPPPANSSNRGSTRDQSESSARVSLLAAKNSTLSLKRKLRVNVTRHRSDHQTCRVPIPIKPLSAKICTPVVRPLLSQQIQPTTDRSLSPIFPSGNESFCSSSLDLFEPLPQVLPVSQALQASQVLQASQALQTSQASKLPQVLQVSQTTQNLQVPQAPRSPRRRVVLGGPQPRCFGRVFDASLNMWKVVQLDDRGVNSQRPRLTKCPSAIR